MPFQKVYLTSFIILKVVYWKSKNSIATDEAGNAIESKIELSDYKPYGKGKATLMLSTKQTMNNNGNIIELTMKSVTISKKEPKGYFEGEME